MEKPTRTLTMVDHDIAKLQDRIKELKKERTAILKDNRRFALSEDMIDILNVILRHPGISREGIELVMNVAKEDYNAVTQSMSRRKIIVNQGTRKEPSWFAAFGQPVD